MKTIGEVLRELRENKGLLIREVAAAIGIDSALLSKIERCDRLPTRGQVNSLSKFFKQESNEIIVAYLSDRIVYEVKDKKEAIQAIQVAEVKIKFQQKIRKR